MRLPPLPLLLAVALLPTAAAARAQCRPVGGCEVPALAVFDAAMLDFMCDNDIGAGALAIARHGVLVFSRSYGWSDAARTTPLRHDALMRLASVSKPITAAAVRDLIAEGRFTLDTPVFDLGQPGGGLLALDPFPSLGDPRLADVTVRYLLEHKGGWDRDTAGDLTYRELQIAAAMGVPSPPGRINTVRYILGRPLQHTPGTTAAYSNIGCLVLGLIVEQERGLPLEEVLDCVMLRAGVPDADHGAGRTFPADQDPREPFYQHPGLGVNVFSPLGPPVSRPYGSWDHEARIGQGGQIATAAALARFASAFYVNGPSIGLPRPAAGGGTWNHLGSLAGTQSLIRQRADGTSYAVIFNSSNDSYAAQIRGIIDSILLSHPIDWPATPTGECCRPDVNADGAVNAADISAFLSAWLTGVESGALDADFSIDGAVNAADISAFLAAWLASAGRAC